MKSTCSPPRISPVVLVVDDNPGIRHVVTLSLRLGGFQPIEAADGLAAAHWMEQSARDQLYPNVILLDLAMPGMDGSAFLEWLQACWVGRYPAPAVILASAGYLNESLFAPFPAVKQFITKPFHIRDLLNAIRHYSNSLE